MTHAERKELTLATIKALAEEHDLHAAWYELKGEGLEYRLVKNWLAKEYHKTRLEVNYSIRMLGLTDEQRERILSIGKFVCHQTILGEKEFTQEEYARMVGYVLA